MHSKSQLRNGLISEPEIEIDKLPTVHDAFYISTHLTETLNGSLSQYSSDHLIFLDYLDDTIQYGTKVENVSGCTDMSLNPSHSQYGMGSSQIHIGLESS